MTQNMDPITISSAERTDSTIPSISNPDRRNDLKLNAQINVKLEPTQKLPYTPFTRGEPTQEEKQIRTRNTPRSRKGCITCRKRKKRCDEAKPVCITCRRLCLECEYPLPGTERKNKQRRRSNQLNVNEVNNEGFIETIAENKGFAEVSGERKISNNLSIGSNSDIPINLVNDGDKEKSAANQLLGLQHDILSIGDNINSKLSNDNQDSTNTRIEPTDIVVSTQLTVPILESSADMLIPNRPQSRNNNSAITSDILIDFDSQVLFPDSVTPITSPMSFSSVPSAPLSDVRFLPLGRNSDALTQPLLQPPSPIIRMTSPNTQSRLVNMLNEQEFDLSEISSLHKELLGSPSSYMYSKTTSSNVIQELDSPILFPGLTPRTEQLLWGPRTLEAACDNIDDNDNSHRTGEIIDNLDNNNYYLTSPSSSSGSSESSTSSFMSPSLGTITRKSGRNRASSTEDLYVHHSTFPSLEFDQFGTYLMDYYQSKLARLISVSSDEYNHFLSVFLPMSTRNDAVLYSILAWTSFHKGEEYDEIGHAYSQRAKELINSQLSKNEPETLAALLLLCAAEICRGDMVQWDKHLMTAARIITRNGGISNLLHNRTLRWLASNFAYHDVLASSTNERGTYFNTIQYDEVFEQGHGLDPLLGCCQPLFQMLSEISELAVESQRISNNIKYKSRYDMYARSFQNSNRNNNDDNFADDRQYNLIPDMHTFICSITEKALSLEKKIHSCVPDTRDMTKLFANDLESQLMLFETFQITAKLHLKQSVLRINPSSLIMQGLTDDLTNLLDKVLDTPVEGGLCFPLFIVGVNSVSMECRNEILSRFESYQKRNFARNIRRAIQLLQEVWKLDPDGTKHVDWYGIIKKRGWDISFA